MTSLTVVEFALFAGAVVSGLAGFAFSAVAGAALFLFLEPKDAVPLLLASSIATQIVSISKLWPSMQWRRCIPLIAGGLVGIPLGATLLLQSNPTTFVAVFGVFLVSYGVLMLVKPRYAISCNSRFADPLAGFVGGVTGGSTAFPGAIPTIWCNLQGLPKEAQRGRVQPYILVMQIFTLVYFSKVGLFTPAAISLSLLSFPFVLAGTYLGLHLYKQMKDDSFRTMVLYMLILSGFGLIAKAL